MERILGLPGASAPWCDIWGRFTGEYNYLKLMEIHIISSHIYLNQNNYLMVCWSSGSQSLWQYRGMNYCQLKKEFLQMMTNPVFCCIFICCWGWNVVKRHRNFRGYEQILYSRIRCVLVALFGRLVNLLPWVSPLIPQSKMAPSHNFTKKKSLSWPPWRLLWVLCCPSWGPSFNIKMIHLKQLQLKIQVKIFAQMFHFSIS